mmetsp:Transcript_20725/g.30672  ORF Transcript_20725/g.30672 Transcript_20725/m.30672 type:complete len:203 (+) Transcript_20725:134-742(+)|eukprot:CAMPEP_0171459266 /NCGR_PEP_ID=MMETSP0945-20130129/4617_1 /TAXON_ID=109269 /ORGANISM="Vaucheria litorea, Strain CCMP2940" /LENGTH=202 /DNA_ID=CAMNT_0011985247 /DNA_START=108 /DNA_END=716 /DNA_ORIENTATION=+
MAPLEGKALTTVQLKVPPSVFPELRNGSFVPGVKIFAGGPSRLIEPKLPYPSAIVLYQSEKHAVIDNITVLGSYPQVRSLLKIRYDPKMKSGKNGGYNHGVPIWAGGKPSELPLPKVRPVGTVLFTTADPSMRPDLTQQQMLKPGSDNERMSKRNRCESLSTLKIKSDPEWISSKQTYRRNAPGHYVAGGATIFRGGNVLPF